MKMFHGLLLVLFAGSCPFASLALAGGTEIYDVPLYGNQTSDAKVTARFRVNEENPELGRAWIEIKRTWSYFDGANETEFSITNRNIPGLRYDPKSREVLYQEAGRSPLVCAKMNEKSFLFFHSRDLEPTGNCELKTLLGVRKKDDGFHIQDEQYARVEFDARERSPASESRHELREPFDKH